MAKRILVAVIFVPLLFVVMFFLPPDRDWRWWWRLFRRWPAMNCSGRRGRGKSLCLMKAVSVLAAAAIPFGAWLIRGENDRWRLRLPRDGGVL